MYIENDKPFSIIEFGAHLPNGFFKRGTYILKEELIEKRKEHYNTGIYTTLYHYQKRNPFEFKKEVPIYGPFYLDFDAEIWDVDPSTAAENLKKIQRDFKQVITYFEVIYGIPREYARCYYSGKKGFHLVYPEELFGIEPRHDLNRIFKELKDDVKEYSKEDTIDNRIYDNKRLFRVPNSKHQDTGLYKVPLEPRFLLNSTIKDLHIAAATPKPLEFKEPKIIRTAAKQYRALIDKYEYKLKEQIKRRKKYQGKTLDYTPPCIKYMLDEGVKKGQRNNSMAALVSYFKQSGLSEEEALAKTFEWSETKCVPPIPKQEIEATVPSIYLGNKTYGCSALKELSKCNEKKCKLKKNS